MDLLSLVLIAVSLTTDAFAVSMCKGLVMRKPAIKSIFIVWI